jgi:hypothetical protein
MKQIFLAAFCLLTFGAFYSAEACSCVSMDTPTCAIGGVAEGSSVVFSGIVNEILPIKVKSSDGRYEYEQWLVKFGVAETFKGTAVQTIEVETGRGGGDCGYNFQVGVSYLVYTYKTQAGNLATGICSRTRELAKATDDLEYFRGLTNKKPVGSLFGVVHESRSYKDGQVREPPRLLTGVRVTIDGPSGILESLTNDDGKYSFDDLKPGEYILKFYPPAEVSFGRTEQKLKILPKACSVYHASFSKRTSVSGRLSDHEGNSPGKIGVVMVPVEEIASKLPRDVRFIETDENGAFTVIHLAPGRYYLGFRIDRISGRDTLYPPIFYPGTEKVSEATEIVVTEGTVIENLNFQLLPKMTLRKIEGSVMLPDNKKPFNPYLCAQEISGSTVQCGQLNLVVKDGKFSFDLPEGLAYRLIVHDNPPNNAQQIHAEPATLPTNGPVKDLKLVISEPGGSCAKCRVR